MWWARKWTHIYINIPVLQWNDQTYEQSMNNMCHQWYKQLGFGWTCKPKTHCVNTWSTHTAWFHYETFIYSFTHFIWDNIYIWVYTRQQLRDPKFGIDMWWPKNPTNNRGLQCPLKETTTTIPSLRIQSHFCCWNIFSISDTIHYGLTAKTQSTSPWKSRPCSPERADLNVSKEEQGHYEQTPLPRFLMVGTAKDLKPEAVGNDDKPQTEQNHILGCFPVFTIRWGQWEVTQIYINLPKRHYHPQSVLAMQRNHNDTRNRVC